MADAEDSPTSTGSDNGEAADDSSAAAPQHPALRILSGNPTPEELAVLTALVSVAGPDEPEPARVRGGWRDPARLRRRQLFPGPGAWRSSGW